MLTAQTRELLRRVRSGRFDPEDAAALEQMSHAALQDEFSEYRYRFQDRRLHDKWEVGLARTLRHEVVTYGSEDALFPIMLLVPVFRHCVFLSGEGNKITGLSASAALTVRPIRGPDRALALTTARGFKLDKTIDGWIIKRIEKRTVKLTEQFLRQRGWQFDVLRRCPPQPVQPNRP